MLLTADIGNTSITLGIFDEDALVEEFRLASDKDLPLEDIQNSMQTIISAINSQITFTLDVKELSKSIVMNLLAVVIIGYTLPLRSICCTILYKNLETKKLKEKKIKEL